MSITLSDGTTTVELPYDLYWSDESWSPIEQATSRGLTGSRIVQYGVRQDGRPITLQQPVGGRGGWMPRSLLAQLIAWRDTPGQQLTLTLRATAYTVQWRHEDGSALTWEALRHRSNPQPSDWVIPTLRFVTVPSE